MPAHSSLRRHTALHAPFPFSACPSLERSVAAFLAKPKSSASSLLHRAARQRMFLTQPMNTLVVALLRFYHNRDDMSGSGCSVRMWLLCGDRSRLMLVVPAHSTVHGTQVRLRAAKTATSVGARRRHTGGQVCVLCRSLTPVSRDLQAAVSGAAAGAL